MSGDNGIEVNGDNGIEVKRCLVTVLSDFWR